MKKVALVLLLWVLALPGAGLAQGNFTESELDTLVSNIALYPDPLLVHVLTASTYGNQIPAASAWAESHKNLSGEALAAAMEEANLNYDPSVQALIPFPTVLAMMSNYKAWCDQLGDAVTSQKDEVMAAVQRMRQSAYDHGHLKSDEKVSVTEAENNITIVPVRTEYVYVPVYNPRVVYYTYADGYTRISYGTGVWLGTWYGEWGWGSCWFDWGPRVIYVRNTRWYAHRPIPHHPHRYVPPPRRGHNPPPPRHNPGIAPPRHSTANHSAVAPAPRQTTSHAVTPRPASTQRVVSPAPAPRVTSPAPRSSAPAPHMATPAPRSTNVGVQPANVRPVAPGLRDANNRSMQRMSNDPPRAESPRVQPRQAPAPSIRSRDDDDEDSRRGSARSSGRSSGGFGKVGRRR